MDDRRDIAERPAVAAGSARSGAAPGLGRQRLRPSPQGLAFTYRADHADQAGRRRHQGVNPAADLRRAADWQRPGNVTWTGNAKSPSACAIPSTAPRCCASRWAADQQNAELIEVTTQVQAQDRSVARARRSARRSSDAERKLQPRRPPSCSPIDGLVKETARGASCRARQRRRRQGRARSTNGWSTTPSAIPRRWAAASATSPDDDQDRQPQRQMCRPQCALCRRWPARSACRRARRLTASASCPRSSATRRWARAVEVVTKAQHCAAPRFGCGQRRGRRSIRPTCARSCSRSRPANLSHGRSQVVGRAQGAVRRRGRQLGRFQRATT